MKSLSIILLAFAFNHVTSEETIPEILQEFTSIIEGRMSEAGQLLGLVGKDIGQTYAEIARNIKEAAQNLKNEIENVEDQVNVAISRANELGQNVDECVADARSSLSNLSVGALQNCGSSNELVNVQKLMPQLGMINRQLGTLVPKCMMGEINDSTTIRTCLSDGLQRIEDSANSLNSDVISLIDNASAVAGKCVDDIRSDIANLISTITNNMNKCVNRILLLV